MKTYKHLLTKEFLKREIVENRKSQKKLSQEIHCSLVTIKTYIDKHKIFDDKNYIPTTGQQRSKFLERIITKEFLYNCFINKKMPANKIVRQIQKEFNIKTDAGMVIILAKRYGIQTFTIKEACNLKSTRDKYKTTCKRRYGIANVSQSDEVKKKKEDTFLKHYGVTNGFKHPDVKRKIREGLLKKYGVEHITYLEDWWLHHNHKSFYRSKLHQHVEKILKENDIKYESEVFNKFTGYNEKLQRKFSPRPDILIEDKKIIIEINGNYWHANPLIHKETDMFYTYKGLISAEDIWKRDRIKKEHIEAFGYKVIII